jgi:exopolysaccharide production protein ExoQ
MVAMKISRTFLDEGFSVVLLFFCTGALITVLNDATSAEQFMRGSPRVEALWLALYAIAAIRAWGIRREIILALRQNLPLLLFSVITLASFLWSADPFLTFRRGLAYLLSVMFAVDFAVRYPLRKQIRLVSIAVGLAVVLSIATELAWPMLIPLGPSDDAYEQIGWHGLFPHKNEFGETLALAVLCVLANLKRTWASYCIGGVCLAGLLLAIIASESRTALVISALMAFLYFTLKAVRWSPRTARTLGIASFFAGIAGAGIIYLSAGRIAEAMGRETNLTGRTAIWSACLGSIRERPLLGYGFAAFWGVSPESERVRAAVGWHAPSAHNTYIEVCLQTGWIGLTLFVLLLLAGVRNALAYVRSEKRSEATWPLLCIVFLVYHGSTESDMSQNSIFWMLLIAASVHASFTRVRKEERSSPQMPAVSPLGPLPPQLVHQPVASFTNPLEFT